LPTVINKKLNTIQTKQELIEKLNESKNEFMALDMQVFDITKTESVLNLISHLESLVDVEDVIF